MNRDLNCLFASVSCTFSCTMKYLVRDCDPNTGEPDDDGYDDEYVVSLLFLVSLGFHVKRFMIYLYS